MLVLEPNQYSKQIYDPTRRFIPGEVLVILLNCLWLVLAVRSHGT